MIENIRKYNILIIIGMVVVAAALIIGLQSGNMGGPGGVRYIKIGSRTYTDTEYRNLGIHGREVINALARSGDYQQMVQLMSSISPEYRQIGDQQRTILNMRAQYGDFRGIYESLFGDNRNSVFSLNANANTEDFFINRMLIRQAKEDYGIHPSEEQVEEIIQNFAAFQSAEGEFDSERYFNFIKKSLGQLGMNERDFKELISDMVAITQMRLLIGSGMQANKTSLETRSALDQQNISGSVARIEYAPFKENLDPTDDQLREYWELIQDQFKTDEERRFSYVIVSPDDPGVKKPEPSKDEPEKDEAEMSEEEKAAAKAKADKEAAEAAAYAEAKLKVQQKLTAEFDAFITELEDREGKGFEELVEKYGWKVQQSELFSQSKPPADFALTLRAGGRRGSFQAPTVASEVFRMTITADPLSKLSEPLMAGEDQYLVARLEETVKSRIKTFEEARDEVRTQYIDEKSREALKQSMDEAAEKINKSLEGGKDFAAAAADAGISLVETFEDTSSSTVPAKDLFPSGLFRIGRNINPGKISETIVDGQHAYLVYISKRELFDNLINPQLIEGQAMEATSENGSAAFADWLSAQKESSKIERYYKTQ